MHAAKGALQAGLITVVETLADHILAPDVEWLQAGHGVPISDPDGPLQDEESTHLDGTFGGGR